MVSAGAIGPTGRARAAGVGGVGAGNVDKTSSTMRVTTPPFDALPDPEAVDKYVDDLVGANRRRRHRFGHVVARP